MSDAKLGLDLHKLDKASSAASCTLGKLLHSTSNQFNNISMPSEVEIISFNAAFSASLASEPMQT
jgi:hypothetical protein